MPLRLCAIPLVRRSRNANFFSDFLMAQDMISLDYACAKSNAIENHHVGQRRAFFLRARLGYSFIFSHCDPSGPTD